MRVGQNPVKVTQPVLTPPQKVTVVVVTFIPYLSGYFEHSLQVLQLCLESLQQNTEVPFDLLVFDNASCPEVQEYLLAQRAQGTIQYLVLSEKNVGIPGAWNFAFRAAPGRFVAFSDYDIYFYPGWLRESLKVMHTFPNVGMVTGIPVRPPEKFSTATIRWAEAQPDADLTRGVLQNWETYWAHVRSLGFDLEKAQQIYHQGEDIQIAYQDMQVFAGAGHFQFISPREVLAAVLPLPMDVAMGKERLLDERINQHGWLRLCLPQKYVQHMGNVPPQDKKASTASFSKQRKNGLRRWLYLFLDSRWIKKTLMFLYNRIFQIYYRRVS